MFVFPSASLLTDEFDEIKKLTSGLALTSSAQNRILQLQPVADKDWIVFETGKTKEFSQLLSAGESISLSGFKDISKEIGLLRIENSILQPEHALNIAALTKSTGEIISFFKNRSERFPMLASIVSELHYEKSIVESVEKILDEYGVVRSSASPELTHIRRTLQRQRAEADRVYQSVMSKYRKNGWLTDSEETSRNGRRVLSIVAEQKRTLKGIIHDLSATGKTAFIEPEEVVGINTSVWQLEQEERIEIIRILRELTSFLRHYLPLIEAYFFSIIELDCSRAKAMFAQSLNAVLPTMSPSVSFNLVKAHHPLLFLHNKSLKKLTVPFSLRLDARNHILVISGPNAGGKTVCMKTVGLLQMMFQSGMLVPVAEGSQMTIFRKLFVDIGDSQSIAYELSTYSSRLQNMKVFLEQADEQSLFLIDEFGSGTDPDLGGALAEALLEELNARKCTGIITTHFMNLKTLADKTQGLVNGSMMFDSKNLKPLFQLQVGKPGSSYTFVVAARSGLSQSLISKARNKVSQNHIALEKLLTKLERDKNLVQKKLQELDDKEKKLKRLMNSSENLIAENEKIKTGMEIFLKKEEDKIIAKYETRMKRVAKDLKGAKNKKQVIDKFLSELGLKREKKNKEPERVINPAIVAGSEVKLYNGRVTGVVEQIEGNNATVVFGNYKTKCKLIDLVMETQEKKEKKDKKS
ncbi:MAG: DNA mismatch repair protein MutS [Bacteroidetes bacterium]|jgi:DNA mismatch repair protein MutS2|nr:DNA mismatch repair protein MutS [Bacteroidota bacterium]